jgi:AcrR family transcriptional regulator
MIKVTFMQFGHFWNLDNLLALIFSAFFVYDILNWCSGVILFRKTGGYMNAKKYLKQAAYQKISEIAIEKLNTKEILLEAEVSKQTFYRYYKDKYELANDLYHELTQKDIIDSAGIATISDWREMYRRQFESFRQHLKFIKHLYTSNETGCTFDYEVKSTIQFDKEYLLGKGADITDPRILFALEAKDVGGTYAMRDWILAGMDVSDEEMVIRFALIIPKILLPYYE